MLNARQYNSPASVHDEIELPATVNYVQGGTRSDASYAPGSQELPPTPGYATYIASSTTIAGVDTRRSRLGLWEVQVTRINAGGATVYDSDQAVTRTLREGTGSGIIAGIAVEDESIKLGLFPEAVGTGTAVPLLVGGGTFTIGVWAFGECAWATTDAWITSAEPPTFTVSSYIAREFTATYGANATGASRTGTIVFTHTASGQTKTLTVTQPG